MERKQKKKAKDEKQAGGREEDPYGGSTDENTDAEEEVDKPIPELPGLLSNLSYTVLCVSVGVCLGVSVDLCLPACVGGWV